MTRAFTPEDLQAKIRSLLPHGLGPPADEALSAAGQGRLFWVDTLDPGTPSRFFVADTADQALEEVAALEEPSCSSAHEGGPLAWARAHLWTASLVTLVPPSEIWIDCGKVGTSAVSARRAAGVVEIRLTETTEPVATSSKTSWPCAEVPDLDEVRRAVELGVGVWVFTPTARDWVDAPSSPISLQSVELLPEQPTTRITFTPESRPDEARSLLVHLADDFCGYSREEIETGDVADWQVVETLEGHEWRCQGKITPGDVPGIVDFEPFDAGSPRAS